MDWTADSSAWFLEDRLHINDSNGTITSTHTRFEEVLHILRSMSSDDA